MSKPFNPLRPQSSPKGLSLASRLKDSWRELSGGGGSGGFPPATGDRVAAQLDGPIEFISRSFSSMIGITEQTLVHSSAHRCANTTDTGGSNPKRFIIMLPDASDYVAVTEWFTEPFPTDLSLIKPFVEPVILEPGDYFFGFEMDRSDSSVIRATYANTTAQYEGVAAPPSVGGLRYVDSAGTKDWSLLASNPDVTTTTTIRPIHFGLYE